MDVMKPKNFDSSFLYGKGNYQTQLFEFVIKSHRVDKTSESFDDIRYMVKKNQYTLQSYQVLVYQYYQVNKHYPFGLLKPHTLK